MKPSSSNVRTPIVSDLTIIVPCYNEEKAVTEVVEALTNSFENNAQLMLIDSDSEWSAVCSHLRNVSGTRPTLLASKASIDPLKSVFTAVVK